MAVFDLGDVANLTITVRNSSGEFTWSSRALIAVPGAVSSLSSLNVTVGGSTRHYRTSRVVAVGPSSGITGYHMSGHVNAYRWD